MSQRGCPNQVHPTFTCSKANLTLEPHCNRPETIACQSYNFFYNCYNFITCSNLLVVLGFLKSRNFLVVLQQVWGNQQRVIPSSGADVQPTNTES